MAKFYTPTKLSENIRETPEGYLLCLSVPIARTGWQDYGEGETPLETQDGVIRIYRDAKEVFRPQTIASFEGKSVTIKHPRDFVNPQNWANLSKGIVQNVRKASEKDDDGEESLLADLLITDEFAIQLVKSGLREVSCGYEAEYEQTGKGKGAQTNIVGNHLALVEEGRAGSSYAINDHKGKVTMSKKLASKIKGLLGKVIDEAVEAEGKPLRKAPDKAKDDDKAKDEGKMAKSEGMKVVDKEMYDELVKMVKDLAEKMDGMKPAHDDDEEKEMKDDDEEKAKDDDAEGEGEGKAEKADDDDEEMEATDKEENEAEGEILERVKALEAALAKLLKSGDNSESEASDDDEELSGAEMGEGEESEGSQKKTGDSKKKGTGLEKTKAVDSKTFESFDNKTEEMTADKLNELNAAHWARK